MSQAHSDRFHGDAEEKVKLEEAAKGKEYVYRSYDPKVSKLYIQRFPWMAASMSVVICSSKTAVTTDTARILYRLRATGERFCVSLCMVSCLAMFCSCMV